MSKKDRNEDSNKSDPQKEKVQTGGWDDNVKVRFRTFPGPAGVTEPLRIAMTKETYADLVGHAKESVDREICGVLLGDLCEDDHGFFLSVEAAVRGGAAKTGGTHVTFTQETWNEIHKEKDSRFPKLQILGWYHSHPGFGVEFSEMDMFIQRNFFSGPSQIAFVSDPLGGEEAICANTDMGIKNIRRFWVDGRERKCYVPREESAASASSSDSGSQTADPGVTRSIAVLEDRIRQLTDAVERQRSLYNFLTVVGMVLAICFLAAAGYNIWRSYTSTYKPPEPLDQMVTVPVTINGKTAFVYMLPVKWQIPEDMNAILVQAEVMRQKEREAAAAAATQAATASQPAPQK